jgi:hypothetical protein
LSATHEKEFQADFVPLCGFHNRKVELALAKRFAPLMDKEVLSTPELWANPSFSFMKTSVMLLPKGGKILKLVRYTHFLCSPFAFFSPLLCSHIVPNNS